MKGIDINKLKQTKKFKVISSEEALKDVIPMDWSEDILSGKKKVILCSPKSK